MNLITTAREVFHGLPKRRTVAAFFVAGAAGWVVISFSLGEQFSSRMAEILSTLSFMAGLDKIITFRFDYYIDLPLIAALSVLTVPLAFIYLLRKGEGPIGSGMPAVAGAMMAGLAVGIPFALLLTDRNTRSVVDDAGSFLFFQVIFCLIPALHSLRVWRRTSRCRDVVLEVMPHRFIVDVAVVIAVWLFWAMYPEKPNALFLLLAMIFAPVAVFHYLRSRCVPGAESNPLGEYMRPWRRARTAAIVQLFLAMLVATGVGALCVALSIHPLASIIVGGMLAVMLFVPWTFVRFARRGTPEQIEELYLTMLTRRQVFYASWVSAARFALLTGAIVATVPFTFLGFWLWEKGRTPNWEDFGVCATICCCLVLMGGLILTKALRIWLLFDDRRWMVLPAAMFISIPEILIILIVMTIFYDSHSTPMTPVLWALIPMTLWNYHIAIKWGLELFYRRIDTPSMKDMFLGRYKRIEVESWNTISIPRTLRRHWFAGSVNILAAAALGYVIFSIMPGGNLEGTGIMLALALLLFAPITFLRFAKRRTPEQIQELYLTLLTRREIFFSSWVGAAFFTLFCTALLCTIPMTLQVLAMRARYITWGMPYPLGNVLPFMGITLAGLLAFSVLLILKALRVWMILDNRRWLIVPVVLFMMIPDLIVIAALFVVAWVMDSRLWIIGGILPMTVWNYRIAVNWGIENLYRPIDPPSLRDLFFGRYHRLKQEEERDAA